MSEAMLKLDRALAGMQVADVQRELRALSLYANGWPEGVEPGCTESEAEEWEYPGGADMVDAVNEMLTRLGLQVPTPEDDGAVMPDPEEEEN